MVSEAEWHRVSRSGPGAPKRRGVPGRVSWRKSTVRGWQAWAS